VHEPDQKFNMFDLKKYDDVKLKNIPLKYWLRNNSG
jgi:hypothetical protein